MKFLNRVGWLNLLLVFIPLALILKMRAAPETWIFVTSAVAIIPLAGLMGRSTELLAERLGPGIGGLLNASFGNAAELIIAVFALKRGLVDVVKASITGSILGNVLLVLGASFLAGGMKFSNAFNSAAADCGDDADPLGDRTSGAGRVPRTADHHVRQMNSA
jgi:Ca2+:H+ antiporter